MKKGAKWTIINLMLAYLVKAPMPERIRYNMMQEGYETFRWDDEAMEYLCEADERVTLRVPWHHLEDEVEIVEN